MKPRRLHRIHCDAEQAIAFNFQTEIEIIGWNDREQIPSISGIYAIFGQYDCLLYVGQTNNLHARFQKHHRHASLLHVLDTPQDYRLTIYYHPLETSLLQHAESQMIAAAHPPLNNTPLSTPPVFVGTWLSQTLMDKLDAYARGLGDATGTHVDIPEAVATILARHLG